MATAPAVRPATIVERLLPYSVLPRFHNLQRLSVFAFYSNRLGCLGSIIASVIGTVVLILLMRGCS